MHFVCMGTERENQKEERCMAQCGAGAWQISLIDGGPHKNIFILQIKYFKYQLGLIRNGKLSFAPVRTLELNIEFASYRRRFIMINCSGPDITRRKIQLKGFNKYFVCQSTACLHV